MSLLVVATSVIGKVSGGSERYFWQRGRSRKVGDIEHDEVVVARKAGDVIPRARL